MEELRRLAVGQSVSGGRPIQEGFELRMGGGPALVLAFRDLTPGEVEGVRSGEAWFGVVEKGGFSSSSSASRGSPSPWGPR